MSAWAESAHPTWLVKTYDFKNNLPVMQSKLIKKIIVFIGFYVGSG
jgi:hypothetical protein